MKNQFPVAGVFLAFAIVAPAFAGAPAPPTCAGATTVNAEQALALFKGNIAAMKSKAAPSGMPTLIVDPRKVSDYQKGHIPGAVNLPIEEGGFTKASLMKATGGSAAKPLLIYCNGENCPRSHMTCQQAQAFGYTGKISYFYTGLGPNGWGRINGPTVAGAKPYPDMP